MRERALVLAAIAPYLAAEELSSALAMASVIGDGALRGRAMVRLSPYLAHMGHLDEAGEAVSGAIEPADRVMGAMTIARLRLNGHGFPRLRRWCQSDLTRFSRQSSIQS